MNGRTSGCMMPSSSGCESPPTSPPRRMPRTEISPRARRGGGQRRDDPREADEGGGDDDEEQRADQGAGGDGAEERVDAAMHGVFALDQVVDRLAVDDDLATAKADHENTGAAIPLQARPGPK